MARTVDPKKVNAVKNEIIDASISLILDKGFSAFKLSSVAIKLGITKAALYWYFPTKEDLVENIANHIRISQLSFIRNIADSKITAKEKLYKLLDSIEENKKSCMLPIKMLIEYYSEENFIKVEIQKGYREYVEILSNILLEGKNNQEFSTIIPEEELSRLLVSTIDGIVIHNSTFENNYVISKNSFSIILESMLIPYREIV
ncbi:TetR/AcrR family transcriptional regulator [Paenibacillus albiflavus]|uniref:TetR/AcrR family transcriptional regulator n=1 Tax=Paenibacillus albiflavus TaxID=2545760 RepID=A0A4R4EM07_9BACL|nr:TetR/AcrR family transcriptional regulator [Paenibacillus albiflavus]TCZ81079.1 TetR/AcrR family transcriptional regulator [Paenibacillus albiflavus]